ncbi:hypothetical protein P691DRAFT_233707 [Macrolepiota fuliginosa MF-IS2]|uniref:RNA polymerase II elongation factor ELL N-terminal domain-containing protein n=1 Tax=Macrolepiota fuliginosa MF-IS2 TaxID=1400762 RepID=A0A9P6C5D8_9AGAR|nr:hypothetical protein P691DRAFT_233707 [Macrolepiota fuliginosa MF-IS2]
MFRKPVRPADQPRRPAPATSTPASSGGASPVPALSQRSKEALQSLRNRMIRCIAVAERTSDQIVKLVGGNDRSATIKRDILELLEEIAEPIPLPNNSKAPKNYRLKTRSWLEVRPYELPGLTESERTSLARSAKLALRDLKIPESDPAWSHVQYRNLNGTASSSVARKQPANGTAPSKAGQPAEPPKRGISSTTAKEKKATKPKDSGEIMMKNESIKAPSSRPSTSNSSNRDDDGGRALPQKPPATRPRPGSGFKAKQPTPTESRDYASGRSPVINGKVVLGEPSGSAQDKDPRRSQPAPSQTAERRSNAAPTQKVEKLRRDEVTASDTERSDRVRDRERERGRERALKAKEKEREGRDRERERRERESEREDRERDRRELDRQRERERAKRREAELESDRERDRTRKKARERDWSQEREEGEHSDDSLRPPKRKKMRDSEEYGGRTAMKKRKMDSPLSKNVKPRDLSLPKKPDVDLPSRPKIAKESSPLPPPPRIKKEPSLTPLPRIKKEMSPLPPLPKIKKEPTPIAKISAPPAKASSSVSSSQLSSSKPKQPIKRRRGSDIYTSSEDEGEIRPPIKREPAPSPLPLATNNGRDEISPQSRSHTSKVPPVHDHAALRSHYESSYLPYLGNFQMLVGQKAKICNLLKKMDKGSSGSVTESDGDGDLLDPDELKKLTSEYYNQHEDLENIQRIFSKKD